MWPRCAVVRLNVFKSGWEIKTMAMYLMAQFASCEFCLERGGQYHDIMGTGYGNISLPAAILMMFR